MRNPLLASSLLLVASVSVGCASNPKALIREGEAALSQRQFDRAATAFKEAQLNPAIKQLDRDVAEVGEAKAFLGKGDLVGAEARLRRMSDQRSAKWYFLGEVALARRDLDAAKEAYRKALERTHGGDTATKLARLIAGEARAFESFNEAAKVLKGFKAEADALSEAARVWRAHLAGSAAKPLLERLLAVSAALEPYPAARVLRARLLEAAGKKDEAASAWNLAALVPPPSTEFQEYAKGLRARLAIERGDSSSLSVALEGADPATAARVRGELASSRRWRGDVEGAMALWRETAKAGGQASGPAAAAAASELERLGRGTEATALWKAAEAAGADSSSPDLRRALAHRLAREGDLLGGCALLRGVEGADASPAARRARDLLRAETLLREALVAHGASRDGLRDRLARAVLLLVPVEPACLEMVGGVVDGAPDLVGATRLEFERAELTRRLRAGELDEARELVRWWKQQRVDASLPKALLASFGETVQAELHGGLREALRHGRKKQAQSLLAAVAFDAKSPALAELRACSCTSSLALDAPRGLRALPEGPTFWGSLVVPAIGLRIPVAGISRSGPKWTVRIPGGTELTYSSSDALEAALGGSLGSAIWTQAPDADPEADERAAWKERWPAQPRVEVR